MANLKDLRKRIRSVQNTKQITKAMKMVAAAKLRRSQDRAVASRPYSERMGGMVRSFASRLSENENLPPLLTGYKDETRRVELLVITADRGLCGSYNSSVIRAVRTRVVELQKEGFQVSVTCVGRKGNDVLKRRFPNQIRKVHSGVNRRLSFQVAEQEVAAELLGAFADRKFDACFMVFNSFKSAMTQVVTWRQLIPVQLEVKNDGKDEEDTASFLSEPEEEELLAQLLPKNVAVQVFQALAEADASEHGARMTAMDNAVRNASEMIRKLTISFNRTRQAAITTELMEIISGSESLKG
ncbi:MAG: F0F1 ATP synthase subunit gamma [Magnetococcales bacterium]|nr:F0F1 ATP synthase subunit gamma [Magnetococcales bacterium]